MGNSPIFSVYEVTLVAWNWLCWEHLDHRHWQTLPVRALIPTWLVVRHLLHTIDSEYQTWPSNFFLFSILGSELRASHLLGRHYYLSHTTSPFCFCYFSSRVLLLCPDQPGLWSSYFCFPHSWDDRNTTMPSFYWLRWGFMNVLPGVAMNPDPTYHCLSNS
jgi:hypothetical protein